MRLAVPPTVHAARLAVRRRLGEHAWLWWSLVLALALSAAGVVHAAWQDAARARASWGEAAPVVRARRHLEPGTPLDLTTVELVSLPAAAVPPGALNSLPPSGSVAVLPIVTGEVVVAARAGPTPAGPSARLPPASVGVAVVVDPATVAALGLVPGTPVDVLTVDPVSGQPSLGGSGGRVVAVQDGAVVVAVPVEVAPAVAAAAAAGSAAVVLRAPP